MNLVRLRCWARSILTWQTVRCLACLVVCKTAVSGLLLRELFSAQFPSRFPARPQRLFQRNVPVVFLCPYPLRSARIDRRIGVIEHRVAASLSHVAPTVGKTATDAVILVVAPSGLWMARYAIGGVTAGLGFATLAIATAGLPILGWRAAVRRRFAAHRVWMLRCFVLLCSAVVIRVIGGLCESLGVGTTFPLVSWISWAAPLYVFEVSLLSETLETRSSPATVSMARQTCCIRRASG